VLHFASIFDGQGWRLLTGYSPWGELQNEGRTSFFPQVRRKVTNWFAALPPPSGFSLIVLLQSLKLKANPFVNGVFGIHAVELTCSGGTRGRPCPSAHPPSCCTTFKTKIVIPWIEIVWVPAHCGHSQ
jgi:hypothetical protein